MKLGKDMLIGAAVGALGYLAWCEMNKSKNGSKKSEFLGMSRRNSEPARFRRMTRAANAPAGWTQICDGVWVNTNINRYSVGDAELNYATHPDFGTVFGFDDHNSAFAKCKGSIFSGGRNMVYRR